MFKRKNQRATTAELGELEERIDRCQRQLADVMASHSATIDAIMLLETQIKEHLPLPPASSAGPAKRAGVVPAKTARKSWSLWRRRVPVPA
jgi:hypothetical protein